MSERGQYVEWRLGGDVDWLEYDYAGESFAADPALFFVPPARFQTLADAKHLNGFETALAKAIGFETRTQRRERGEHDKPALFDLLDALRERSVPGNGPPLSAYRLGVSDNRAPGWVKLIVNGVQVDALRAALTAISLPFEDVFTPVEKLYKDFGGPEQEPIIGLSIDSLYGDIAGVDVECPYFNGLDIPQPRTDALQRFTSGLCERQVLTAELAERINAACYREFMDETHEARLFMNHFKFGIAGRTRGRLKAYFEVNTRRQAS